VPSSSAAIIALEQGVAQDGSLTLWASYKDGSLRLWDTKKNVILTTVSTEKRAQYSALAVAPGSADDDALRILAASNGIQVLSIQTSTSSSAVTAKEICSYTGHASPVKALRWDPPSPNSPSRFYSAAEDDRFVYIWDAPDGTVKGKLAASYPIEADVRQIAVTSTQNSKVLLVTSASGKVSLVPVPSELSASGTKSSKTQVPTLLSRSTVVLAKKKGTSAIHIIDAAFDEESMGSLRVAVSDGAQVGFVAAVSSFSLLVVGGLANC
jgi:U3 small nucleolar RNA-associated protein 5